MGLTTPAASLAMGHRLCVLGSYFLSGRAALHGRSCCPQCPDLEPCPCPRVVAREAGVGPEQCPRPWMASQPPSYQHPYSISALKQAPETQAKAISALGGQPALQEEGYRSPPGTPMEICSGCPTSLLPSRSPAMYEQVSEWEPWLVGASSAHSL